MEKAEPAAPSVTAKAARTARLAADKAPPVATPVAAKAPPAAAPAAPPAFPPERLLSLDALRGFDMMWIVGADALGSALSQFRGGALARFAARQLEHEDWAGLHFEDLIFPLFVFMVGVAIPYSLDKIIEAKGQSQARWRILRRTVLLFLAGLLYYGGIAHGLDQLRLMGVLQRIALCYGAASLMYLNLSRRDIALAGIGLLVGYWALLAFVPVPGFGPGDYHEGHNLTNWLDSRLLPLRKWDGDHDPEGLLSTFPAIATCLVGLLAGTLLRDPAKRPWAKVALLAAAGAGLLVVGLVWGQHFPIIKKIWTSSFVLVAGGWSLLLLAGFYLVADVLCIRSVFRPLAWVGSNALAIYLVSNVVDVNALTARLVGGGVEAALNALWPGLGTLVLVLLGIALCVLLCGFLYRRRIFLRL
jgi:predicted acyltransferase